MNYVDGVRHTRTEGQPRGIQKGRGRYVRTLQGVGRAESRRVLGDDVPQGKVTSFPMAVKCEPDEVVVFSWIVWPSKAVRDEGHKK